MGMHSLVCLLLIACYIQVGHCSVARHVFTEKLEGHPVVETAHERVFTCPGVDGFYPSPQQCVANYYQCSDGIAYPQTCPAGNVFDPVTSVCTPSSQASCNQKLDCPSNGLFPYPGACTNLYYVCSAGESYVQYCPVNYAFDPVTLRCVAVEDASCTPSTSTTTISTTPTTVTTQTTSTTTAPASTTGTSITPETAPTTSTEISTIPTTTTSSTSTTVPTTTAEISSTTTPSIPSTTKSIPVTTPTAIPTNTPTTSLVTTEVTTAKLTTTPATIPTTPGTAPPVEFACSRTGNYPYPGNCGLYYVCGGGVYIVAACPDGQVFDPSIEYCENPMDVPGCEEWAI